jgi:hypothetical protein
LKTLHLAKDKRIVVETESALASSDSLLQRLIIDQVLQLAALGGANSLLRWVGLAGGMTALATDWLMYTGTTGITHGFWLSKSSSQPIEYSDLFLEVLAEETMALKDAFKTLPSVCTAPLISPESLIKHGVTSLPHLAAKKRI